MPALRCPLCGALSTFETVWEDRLPRFQRLHTQATSVAAMRCNNDRCSAVIGAAIDGNGQMLVHWPSREITRRTIQDVPVDIAAAAAEAHFVHDHGAHRAAAVLARAVVEATAKHEGFTQGGIAAKIDAMYEAGRIREHIKEAAHEVRYLGNEMAHGDFINPVTIEEAAEVLQLMDEVLDEVFQSPARVERRRAARKAKVQPAAASGAAEPDGS